MRRKFPQAADLLEDAAEDVAYMHFPCEHWRQLHSTNTLERINKEFKRRTRVVGIFPNDSLMRMAATLLQEQDDEWQVAYRRYFQPRVDAPNRSPAKGGRDSEGTACSYRLVK